MDTSEQTASFNRIASCAPVSRFQLRLFHQRPDVQRTRDWVTSLAQRFKTCSRRSLAADPRKIKRCHTRASPQDGGLLAIFWIVLVVVRQYNLRLHHPLTLCSVLSATQNNTCNKALRQNPGITAFNFPVSCCQYCNRISRPLARLYRHQAL